MPVKAKLIAKLKQLKGRLGMGISRLTSRSETTASDTPYTVIPSAPTAGVFGPAEPVASATHPSGESFTGAPNVTPSLPEPDVHALVEQAKEEFDRAHRIGAKTGEAVEQVPNQWEAAETTVKLWDEVVAKLAIFTAVADEIGKVHPYVGAVTSVITSIVKPIERQHARDDAFERLLGEMIRTCDLVKKELRQDARRPKKPPTYQTKLLLKMSSESERCARFIKDEYIAKNFCTKHEAAVCGKRAASDSTAGPRATKNTFRGGEVDKRIEEFRNNFADYRESWRDEQVAYIKDSAMLDKLARVPNGGPLTQKSCLPNTRVGLLRALYDWLDDKNGSRARYLVGVAGSGKSAVAHTVAVAMQEKDRLGSFFAFDRSEPDRGPTRVLGTIAYDLALINDDYRDALIRCLGENPKLADSADIDDQWRKLIVGPSSALSLDESLLIVIDAFDECSESSDDPFRLSLLNCLTAGVSRLPAQLRVLVTSRAEANVIQATRPLDRLDMVDFTASKDIRIFIQDRLLRDDGLSLFECADLVKAADGLFQWAATICRFLTRMLAGTTMRERFETYRTHLAKEDLMSRGGQPSLYVLYNTVLTATFDTEMDGAMSRYRIILALMLCVGSPLSIDDIQSIYNLSEGSRAVQAKDVLAHMGVVLEGTSNTSSPVRPMHTSFRDFLFDESRSHIWTIRPEDRNEAHAIMALGSIRLLTRNLRFNICDVPSSHTSNYQTRIVSLRLSSVPAALRYGALNFAGHISVLRESPRLERIRTAFRNLLYDQFLFWLEFLTLSKEFQCILYTLQTAQGLFRDRDTREFVADAISFYATFRWEISWSAPRIYVAALPFTPICSLIRQRFLPWFSGLPVIAPIPPPWRSDNAVDDKEHIDERYKGITFEPTDDHPTCIAAVSDTLLLVGGEHVMEIIDAGNSLHTTAPTQSSVRCVACSLKHRIIVSGHEDGSLLLSRFATLEKLGVLEGHVKAVVSVSFTPDEDQIISGSIEGTIRRWGAATGKLLQTLNAPGVVSLTCSPDGRFLFSGHADTIQIWDLPTGEATTRVLCDATKVSRLSHSPQRQYLAAVVYKGAAVSESIQVWNTATNEVVGQFRGHARDFQWSPCGRYIAICGQRSRTTGSGGNGFMLLWDSEGMAAFSDYCIYSSQIDGVSFSPSGRSIFSFSKSSIPATVRVQSTASFLCSPAGFSESGPDRVAYSADGRFIRADDKQAGVRCFDSQTGVSLPVPCDATWRYASTDSVDDRLKVGFDGEDIVVHALTTDGTPTRNVLHGHQDRIIAGDISPDGRRLVTVSLDHSVRLWDLDNYVQIGDPFVVDWEAEPRGFTSVSFSPDGLEIAASALDSLIRVWPIAELTTGELQLPPFWHDAVVVGSYGFPTTKLKKQHVPMGPRTEVGDLFSHFGRVAIGGCSKESIDANKRHYTAQVGHPDFDFQPPKYYARSPGVRLVLGRPDIYTIDFSNARLGTEWAQCYQPSSVSQSTNPPAT